MAMPTITPREAGKTVVAAGIGNYKGYSAVGAGGDLSVAGWRVAR